MKLTVGVMFGGESVEHEISVISAAQAMAALNQERYQVVPIYISKDRLFYSDEILLSMDSYRDLKALVKKIPQVTFYRSNQDVIMTPVKKKLFGNKEYKLDVVIPVMHGTNGEDGSLQGFLETLKVPYAGCNVIAAAVGQDKAVMKHILENSKLPVCPWTWFYQHELETKKEQILQKVHEIGYPVIVKPACLGSSVGIGSASNEEEVKRAIHDAAKFDRKIIVEKKIEALREINAAVLGNAKKQRVSVLEEVGKTDAILSYKDKYQGGAKSSKGMASATRIIPAPISEELTSKIQSLAQETFRVLDSSGVSRIDFMLDEKTGQVYINEINTIPGSLAFYLWEKSGTDFAALMDELVHLAIDRKRQTEKMTFSYDTNILSGFQLSGAKGSKQTKD